MSFFKRSLLVVLLFSISFSSLAWWGVNGHRVIGEIADYYLTKKARKAIKEILGEESVAMSSNWADFIKSDSTYDYLYSWHYINSKGGMSHDEFTSKLLGDTGTNLYTKTNLVISELKNNKQLSQDKKVLYLRLLIHFIGDLHQPLHAGGRPEDRGGNGIKVLWFNEPTNLHSIWDDRLVEFQKLSYTEYAKNINHVSRQQRLEWQNQPMTEWFYESYQISQGLYADIKQPDQKLGYDYNFKYVETLNKQLLKGGIRLAAVLNEIFG